MSGIPRAFPVLLSFKIHAKPLIKSGHREILVVMEENMEALLTLRISMLVSKGEKHVFVNKLHFIFFPSLLFCWLPQS